MHTVDEEVATEPSESAPHSHAPPAAHTAGRCKPSKGMRIELTFAVPMLQATVVSKDVIDPGMWYVRIDGTSAPRRERLEGYKKINWRPLPAE